MACPCCVMGAATAVVGAGVGKFIGIEVPSSAKGKFLMGAASALLTLITTVALKQLAGISICGTYGYSFVGIALATTAGLAISVVYMLGISYLLKRFGYLS